MFSVYFRNGFALTPFEFLPQEDIYFSFESPDGFQNVNVFNGRIIFLSNYDPSKPVDENTITFQEFDQRTEIVLKSTRYKPADPSKLITDLKRRKKN